MRIRVILTALALTGAALTACGGNDGGGPGPVPGLLTVSLTGASSAAGALMFTISGGKIDAVSAAGYHTYQSTISPTSRRVMLTGNISAGTLVQIQVPDVAKASSYSVSILQVAARATSPVPYQQLATAGFPVSVH
jgi:hypothetical protein